MRDVGYVTRGRHEGKEVVGIRVSWDKRYITLGPVATLVGLAFHMFDPENILGRGEDIGIVSGDQVRVFNDRDACLLRAEVDHSVQAGVICAPSVRWASKAPDRRNVNFLTSNRLTDAGAGPTFYSCLVQMEKSGD